MTHTANLGDERPLPLDGITVLDLGQIYQGPYASFLLAMAGARVVKVEPRIGETMRARGPTLPWAMLNSCKESVTIDLKSEQGIDVFMKLVASVDVMVVNYAPGVPERLGIGYDQVSQVNPALIYAHASGFGVRNTDGSLVDTSIPAMDISVQAHMAAMTITGRAEDPPTKSGNAFVDFLGGTHLYGAVTTALFERERTGLGRSLEVSMAEAAYFTLTTALGQWHLNDGEVERSGNRHIGGALTPYDVYECADGHVAMICATNRHWRAVLTLIGREDLHRDERYAQPASRVRNIAEVDALVNGWAATRRRSEVAEALQDVGVPAAAVRIVNEVVHDEALISRKALQWTDHPQLGEIPLPHSPIRFHGSELLELIPSRALGADTRSVLSGLAGLSSGEIDDLEAADIITPRIL